MGGGQREELTREEAAATLTRAVEELNDVLDGVTMSEGTEATIRRDIDAYSMAVDALLEKVDRALKAACVEIRPFEERYDEKNLYFRDSRDTWEKGSVRE